MHILLFILLFIITIIVFGLSVVGLILKAIFGIGRRSSSLRKSNKTGYCFYFRFAAKNSFINVAHSSAITPFTTTVLGCRAEPAYF